MKSSSKWKIDRISKNLIKVSKDFFCDYPIKYVEGDIVYDFPERVPKYIKRIVEREFNR